MVEADDYRLPLPDSIKHFYEAKTLMTNLLNDWVMPVSQKMLAMYPEYVAEQIRLAEQFMQSI